jgi:hypothetical protein
LLVAEIVGTAYYRQHRRHRPAADVRTHGARRGIPPPLPCRPHRHRAAALVTPCPGALDTAVPLALPGRRHRRLGRPPLGASCRRHQPPALHRPSPQRRPRLAGQAGGRIPIWSKRKA